MREGPPHDRLLCVGVCAAIAIVLFRRRKSTAGAAWGVAAGILFVIEIGTLGHGGGSAATTQHQGPNYDAYRDCILNMGRSKRACVQYARRYGQSVAFADEALTPEPAATDADETEPPATPEPTPDNHALRAAAQQYWNPVVNELGVTGAAIGIAAAEIQDGDDVAAQQILARAADSADAAYQAAGSNSPPDGDTWQTIQGELLGAEQRLQESDPGVSRRPW